MKYFINSLKFSVLIISVPLLQSCGDSKTDNFSDKIENIELQNDSSFSDQSIKQVMKSIPSPIELTSYIKVTKAPYSNEFLNDPNNANEYVTLYKKALNIGVYGTDLSYINLYNKVKETGAYYEALKKLTTEMGLSAFLDFEHYKVLLNNNIKPDSVINILTSDYERMNTHLTDKGKSNLSSLMICGGWIESLHIACKAFGEIPQDEIFKEKLMEQKIVLEDVLFFISFYKSEPGFDDLIKQLTELKALFDKVDVKYTEGSASEVKAQGDAMVVEDNSNSEFVVKDEDFKNILNKIESVRNNIISK